MTTTTALSGFDEALAVVLVRRTHGQRCPYSRVVYPPLPTDERDGWTLRARALAALPSERRDLILALLAVGGWGGTLVQLPLPLPLEERRAA